MPLILAIDTSATAVSCALLQDDAVIAALEANTGLTHSQTLMPMVQTALQISGHTVAEVDAFAVNAGPGSFTGVRIGVSAVKGLAFPGDKPCIAVSTLESMAQRVEGIPLDSRIVCVMDARCQQVYTAVFSLKPDGSLCREIPDTAMAVGELKDFLKKEKNLIFLVGDGSEMCYNAFKDELPSVCLAPPALRYQSAVGTALVARQKLAAGETVTARELLPGYLRLPQAERELRRRTESTEKKDSMR